MAPKKIGTPPLPAQAFGCWAFSGSGSSTSRSLSIFAVGTAWDHSVSGPSGRAKSSTDWAAAIRTMTRDPARHAALCRTSFDDARTRLTWNAWAQRMAALLRAAAEVYDSRFLTNNGPRVRELEANSLGITPELQISPKQLTDLNAQRRVSLANYIFAGAVIFMALSALAILLLGTGRRA